MTDNKTNLRSHRWFRFIIGGGINTSVTYAVYLTLNMGFNYQWSYFIAYICGIIFSYWFNALFVFKAPLSWKGLLAYPVVYVVQYGVSALLLGFLVESAVLSETLAPLLVVVITVPLTYVMSKLVIHTTQP